MLSNHLRFLYKRDDGSGFITKIIADAIHPQLIQLFLAAILLLLSYQQKTVKRRDHNKYFSTSIIYLCIQFCRWYHLYHQKHTKNHQVLEQDRMDDVLHFQVKHFLHLQNHQQKLPNHHLAYRL